MVTSRMESGTRYIRTEYGAGLGSPSAGKEGEQRQSRTTKDSPEPHLYFRLPISNMNSRSSLAYLQRTFVSIWKVLSLRVLTQQSSAWLPGSDEQT